MSIMEKTYIMTTFQRIMSLGLQKYGAKIHNDVLKIYHLQLKPVKIDIKQISKIYYGITSTPVYVLEKTNGDQVCIPTSFFNGKTSQQLITDLMSINEGIKLDKEVMDFLSKEIQNKKKLRFDFTHHKGETFRRDFELSVEYPGLDTAMGLGIVLGSILILSLFAYGGYYILSQTYTESVPVLRVISLIVSALSLCVMLTNIVVALVSMYLGHKVTIISSIVFVVGLLIAFL
jgi:hypothetical protein